MQAGDAGSVGLERSTVALKKHETPYIVAKPRQKHLCNVMLRILELPKVRMNAKPALISLILTKSQHTYNLK